MASVELSLGFSPCPNDTFVFDALVHGRVATHGLAFRERLEDVETLNRLAADGALNVTKSSYGAIPWLLDRYALLRSGGALGRGCGPLVVAREPLPMTALRGRRIAIPGARTTANLLLRLFDPALSHGEEHVYSDIMPAVARGEVDAGLIIHESRFTYREHGLVRLLDLGEWWEGETGLPIPLGGILAKRELGAASLQRLADAIRASVEHAFAHPQDSAGYVRQHAREMDPEVVRRHIELYVNRFSVELGHEGEQAVATLFARGRAAGILPTAPSPFAR
ncbi:MAG: 1,4-dihydroxy-6-naphthoate synthase [Longimicrobiaceae bacterium]